MNVCSVAPSRSIAPYGNFYVYVGPYVWKRDLNLDYLMFSMSVFEF